MNKINAIFSADVSGGFSHHGCYPWARLHEEINWFEKHTENQIVIMGRKTWDDPKFTKFLKNRINYVVTSKPLGSLDARTLTGENYKQDIINLSKMYNKNIFILGGKSILEDCRDIIDNIYLTFIKNSYRMDTKLNLTSFLTGFRARTAIPREKCTFMLYSNEFKCINI